MRLTGEATMIETVIFYVFAVSTVITATAVVTVRNPVHAALFLVLTFFTSAIIWSFSPSAWCWSTSAR
jgi:NADH:ubiquinone oxidoreductase subunit 6 (subunit J)